MNKLEEQSWLLHVKKGATRKDEFGNYWITREALIERMINNPIKIVPDASQKELEYIIRFISFSFYFNELNTNSSTFTCLPSEVVDFCPSVQRSKNFDSPYGERMVKRQLERTLKKKEIYEKRMQKIEKREKYILRTIQKMEAKKNEKDKGFDPMRPLRNVRIKRPQQTP